MKFLIKFIAALIIIAISVLGSNVAHKTLSATENGIAKAYKQKRTEKLSFKNRDEAEKYMIERGTKIEAIAKELGLKYIMSDDKGMFYNSDIELDESFYKYTMYGYVDTPSSENIYWFTNIMDYSTGYLNNKPVQAYEVLEVDISADLTEIDEFKDDKRLQFFYRYLTEIEKHKIKYEDLLNEIKENAVIMKETNRSKEIKIQLLDGLYMSIPNYYTLRFRINTPYKTRVIKEVNDIDKFFLKVKNSKEGKERILRAHTNTAYNDYIDEFDFSGFKEESKFDFEYEPTVGKFEYNKNVYPNLSNEDKIYSIDFTISFPDDFSRDDLTALNCQKKASEEASTLYDFVSDIYQGSYPLSKEEFTNRYVKYYLENSLDLFHNSNIQLDKFAISPGINIEYGTIKFNIPLKFN